MHHDLKTELRTRYDAVQHARHRSNHARRILVRARIHGPACQIAAARIVSNQVERDLDAAIESYRALRVRLARMDYAGLRDALPQIVVPSPAASREGGVHAAAHAQGR